LEPTRRTVRSRREAIVTGADGLRRGLVERTGARRFLIRVPLLERDWTIPLRRELGLEWLSDATHFTEYTVPQFESELAAAGLEMVDLQLRWSEIWAEAKRSAS
jgi:hypothetical protein